MPRVTLIDKLILGGALLFIVILLTIASTLDQSVFSPVPSATSTPISNTTSLGGVTFPEPSLFGLATSPEQILVKTYIPPCDMSFDYCFYYLGNDFAGTNFESAGVRVLRRPDLATREACLSTLPAGYSNIFPTTKLMPNYAASIFSNLGDAGAGHYASGELYRLSLPGTCLEVEARRGFTQFANYPAGTIREFTEADRDILEVRMNQIIKHITLTATGETIIWPESED